jgi:acetyltransferase
MQQQATTEQKRGPQTPWAGFDWQLPNGQQVQVRAVQPQDAALQCAFVAGLSRLTRRARFHGAINGLSPARALAMCLADGQREVALVVLLTTEGADGTPVRRLIADARYVVQGPHGEFAVVVADEWAGLGLASRLLQLLAERARDAGLRGLRGEVLAGNERMLALVQRLGFVILREDDEVVTVEQRCAAARTPAPVQPATGWWAALLQRVLPWAALTTTA